MSATETTGQSSPVVNPVLSPAIAYVTTSMLKDVLVYGTAKSLRGFSRERPAAGKTGTTDDNRDAWFIGYTPQLLTGVWVGQDKPTPMGRGFTGGAICAPIWERFMRSALADKPAIDFQNPESPVSVQIEPVADDEDGRGPSRVLPELSAPTPPPVPLPKNDRSPPSDQQYME